MSETSMRAVSCGTGHNIKHDDRAETMTGPFKWDLVNVSNGQCFSLSISRTLKTQEITTAHQLWSKLNMIQKGFFPDKMRTGCWSHLAETAPEQGMPDGEWKTAVG